MRAFFSLIERLAIAFLPIDININMNFTLPVKNITMVELRTHSERIVRELKRGERMMLSYRGQPLAELVPAGMTQRQSPLEALDEVQRVVAEDPHYGKKAEVYLRQLREDQKAWGERTPS